MKSGQENQDKEVDGPHEGQIEVQRAEEMLEDSQGRPQQEGELDGAARAEIEKGQAGGTLRREWKEVEEGIKNMKNVILEIEIHSQVRVGHCLQVDLGQRTPLDWAIKNWKNYPNKSPL